MHLISYPPILFVGLYGNDVINFHHIISSIFPPPSLSLSHDTY